MTDTNICGVNQLDVNSRLPPRKRLLAGLKNKYCDSPSPSSSSPSPSPSSIFNDLNVQLRELLNSSSKGSNLSLDKIVESSRSAALTAAKVAATARAVAEEKAAIAAKANAAAKSALELLTSFSGEIQQERCLKRSKAKKQVPVKLLYRKRKLVKNHETDEELARKLHRAMNSSPRITKSSSSDSKTRNHKKHTKHITSEIIKRSDGGASYEVSKSTCDSNYEAGAIDHGESVCKMFEKKPSEYTVNNCSKMDEANMSYSKGQVLGDSAGTNSRKRGRLKQKKLLLSLCSIRDRQNAKDEPDPRIFPAGGEPKGKLTATDVPLLPTKPSSESEVSLEPVRKWKFKEFNTPQCYNGSDILRPLCSNSSVTTASAMIEVDQ